MPDDLENLCDLVERRAAKHCIPLARLWERVFAAISDEELDFDYPDEFELAYGSLKHRIPLAPPWAPEIQIETLCTSARADIKNGVAFDPWKQGWVRHMLVSLATFDKALFPADKKRGQKCLVDRLADFIRKEFPNGVPPGVTNKQIAQMAEAAIGKVVSTKTVTRAKKKSDGTN